MEEQKFARSTSASAKDYIYIEYKEIAEKLEKLKKRVHGEAPNKPKKCQVEDHTVRETHLVQCQGQECGKWACEKHVVERILCTKCHNKEMAILQSQPSTSTSASTSKLEPSSFICQICRQRTCHKKCKSCKLSMCKQCTGQEELCISCYANVRRSERLKQRY